MDNWKKIKTSCKLCHFAVFDGKTQKGCQLNRIYKYGRRGDDVVPCYDEESEFFVINGRGCTTYRDIKWANSHLDEDLIELVKKEIKLNYTLFISIDGQPIEDVINCVKNLDIPPVKFCLLNRQSKRHHSTLLYNYKKPWEEIGILDDNQSDYWYVNSHILSNKVRSVFYLLLNDNKLKKINHIVNRLDELVNNDLRQIECITNGDEIAGGLVLMHKMYGRHYIDEVTNKHSIVDINEL